MKPAPPAPESPAEAGEDASVDDVVVVIPARLGSQRLPGKVLARHIEASRDLAHVLKQAERYRDELSSPAAAAAALVSRLPTASKRMYGHGSVLVLTVEGTATSTGITLAGERETLRRPRSDGLVQPDPETRDVPELTVSAEALLDWLDDRLPTESLAKSLPAWASRNVVTALGSVKRTLDRAIPAPPPLRDP